MPPLFTVERLYLCRQRGVAFWFQLCPSVESGWYCLPGISTRGAGRS